MPFKMDIQNQQVLTLQRLWLFQKTARQIMVPRRTDYQTMHSHQSLLLTVGILSPSSILDGNEQQKAYCPASGGAMLHL